MKLKQVSKEEFFRLLSLRKDKVHPVIVGEYSEKLGYKNEWRSSTGLFGTDADGGEFDDDVYHVVVDDDSSADEANAQDHGPGQPIINKNQPS